METALFIPEVAQVQARILITTVQAECQRLEGTEALQEFRCKLQIFIGQSPEPAKLATLKEELGGATPLERLLVERVVACWLHVYYIDALYANRLNEITWAESDYFQRRQERAHRQYLLAIRTLATVRRLLVPAVQVNIGAQQLNVANASTGKQR
jgi:hypothetical protein